MSTEPIFNVVKHRRSAKKHATLVWIENNVLHFGKKQTLLISISSVCVGKLTKILAQTSNLVSCFFCSSLSLFLSICMLTLKKTLVMF